MQIVFCIEVSCLHELTHTHSFVQAISIAPLQVHYYSEVHIHTHALNVEVFAMSITFM